ncbi:MAG TPA: hypothetical protein PJ986_09440 [Gammaproteobacteria bacterium]|nr:hypothetical protein [Gammaproteobacteria bacterium]
MTTIAMEQWGRRLSDTLRAALREGDFERAAALVAHGDGMARSLAKEYSLMYRGLGITIRVMLESLAGLAREWGVEDALVAHCRAFVGDLNRLYAAAWQGAAQPVPAAMSVAEASALVGATLAAGELDFDRAHGANAQATLAAIQARDAAAALALVDVKERALYLPLHDRFVRFMADSMAFALKHGRDEGLMRFQMETAEGQKAGFDKWEEMSAAEFAQVSAFLLKLHMGEVTVTEDAQRYTLQQKLCGSGGRLRTMGAYEGPNALPFVEQRGPLTFGQPRLPVYCSHCPVWNGVATLKWYGRVHWLFEDAARADGGCTAHIYKRKEDQPEALVAPLRG